MIEQTGNGVIAALAEIYPQLYLHPGDTELYADVVRRGKMPESRSLSHFRTDVLDEAAIGVTPAGTVQIIKLTHRSDFELLYVLMGFKCVPTEIAPQTGAVILDGVINWNRIRNHQTAFLAEHPEDAWHEEFRRFTSEKSNYLDALILLSSGNYSGIPAERFGYPPEEWLRLSYEIRKAHELTHFLCRRKYPMQKNVLWDELAADAVGIVSALGRYDRTMAAAFLGVSETGYTGGRLETYTGTPEAVTPHICTVLQKIEALYQANQGIEPFAFAELLEAKQTAFWGTT